MAIGDVKARTVKRPDGTIYTLYQGEYRDRDGKRCFVSDKLKKQAQKKLRTAMDEVDQWKHAKGNETLEQAIKEYLDDEDRAARQGDKSKAHAEGERRRLARVPAHLRRKKLTEFKNSLEFKKALKEMRSQGVGVRYAIGIRGAIGRVFKYAMEQYGLPRNVIRDFPIDLPKPPKRSNHATTDDGSALLQVAWNQQRTDNLFLVSVNLFGILCLLMSGLRPEEVGGLQITDIRRFDSPPDRPNVWAELTIQHTNTFADGFRKRTKNDEVRIVQVGRFVADAFDRCDRYWQAREYATGPGHISYRPNMVNKRTRRFVERSTAPLKRRQHGFMFVNLQGKPYNANSIKYHIAKLSVEAGQVQRDGEGRILIGAPMASKPVHVKLRERRNRPPEGEPFVWLTRELLSSDAWRTAPINTRRFVERLLLEHMAHGGTENGKLICTVDQCLQWDIGGRGEVTKAQRDAIARGLAYIGEKGFWAPGRAHRPSRYGIGWLPGHDGAPAPNLWKRYPLQDIESSIPTQYGDRDKLNGGTRANRSRAFLTKVPPPSTDPVSPPSTEKMNLPPGWRMGKGSDGRVRPLCPGPSDRPWIGVPLIDGAGDELEQQARRELTAWRNGG